MNTKQFNKLVSKVLAGEANPYEKKRLELWIGKSPQNKETFDKLRNIWDNWNVPKPEDTPSFEEFWNNLNDEISLDNSINEDLIQDHSPKHNRVFTFPKFAIAATILLVICSIYVFKEWANIFLLESYKTNYTEKLSIVLPEGSHVQLNSDSQIQFKKNFNDSVRNVLLSGQAFFEVIEDSRPFIVNTVNATILVKGTRFDVKNRGNKTRVIVKQGSVKMISRKVGSNVAVLLKENEMSYCVNSHEPSKPVIVDADLMTGWLKNILVFDKTPLSEIVDELKRYYGIHIKLAEDDDLKDLELSGEFSNQPAEEVISLICLALDLNYKYDNETIVISR